jgi:hypothetical protein
MFEIDADERQQWNATAAMALCSASILKCGMQGARRSNGAADCVGCVCRREQDNEMLIKFAQVWQIGFDLSDYFGHLI